MLGPRARRGLALAALLLLGPWVALLVAAAFTPLPAELREGQRPSTGVVLEDRSGVVLRELGDDEGARSRWTPLADVGDRLQRAVIAAEDRRFARHPGVDPIA